MNSTVLIKASGIGNYQCLQFDGQDSELFVGDGERLSSVAEQASLVYIAPAEAISLRTVSFDGAERKMLRQTIPYSLEDDLVDDVDTLHFALGTVADNTVPLAIVNRQPLQQWLDDLQQQGVEVQQLVPELQLLPLPANGWTLLVDEQQWLLRYSEQEGFALEADSARLAMQLLLDETDELPQSLQVYCPPEQQALVLNQLPELLRGVVEWKDDDYWQLIAEGFKQQAATPGGTINLLQGDYALRLPWQKWWKNWRLVAVLLLAATLFQLVSTFTAKQILESRNLELRTEIEQVYRTVVPRGAVMDPERQLRRKLNALKGSGGAGFVSLLDRVGQELAKVEGLVLQSLNYTEKQTEIRLTVLANTFDDVETVRTKLEQLGLSAELTGSSAEGSKTRARLRIRGNG